MKASFFIISALILVVSNAISFSKSRNSQLVGAYSQFDLDNPPQDFNKAKEYVLNNYLKECNNNDINSSVQLCRPIAAYVQIVAGTNFKIVFRAENYKQDTLTVVVFESLPDEDRQVHFSISSCK